MLLSIEVLLVVIWGCVYFDVTTVYSANYLRNPVFLFKLIPVTLVSLVET